MAAITTSSVVEPGLELMERLSRAGVQPSDMKIRGDNDLDTLPMTETAANQNNESNNNNGVVEIKTLVWEVSCNYNENSSMDQSDNNNAHMNTNNAKKMDRFYVVSAKKMEDKVDLSLLRDIIYKHQDLPFGCTPSKVSMAPTEVAESLTGFQSGCMPPIGHNVPMKLYLEESIVDYPTASIGSGTIDHSLLLPMNELIKIAENSNEGSTLGSFRRLERSQSPSSVMETNTEEPEKKTHKQKKKAEGGPEPKDRLREYRLFSTIVDKAKLLRTTARKKGRVEIMAELIQEAVKTGEFCSLLQVSEHDGLDKNALHLSAWRGDCEVVQMLVETAQKECPELDIVNMYSRGPGNYGKTPIFYALTQCREDVVRFLVGNGASLLFVNNKGQTPCSIARSHFEKDACDFLFEAERQQLKNGGTFANFRLSHSDNKLYGDLDPRFEVDKFNMGEDLLPTIEEYKNSIIDAEHHGGYPTNFTPRSLRPTVRWWKREDQSLANANSGNLSGQITFTQPRITGCSRTKNVKVEKQQNRQRKNAQEKVLFQKIDVEVFEKLTIDQILKPYPDQTIESSVTTVDSVSTLKLLDEEIDRTITLANGLVEDETYTTDDALVMATWGLDCEWLPGTDCGRDNPVSTLQLSSRSCSFLLDLQVICQALHREPNGGENTATNIELQLNEVLGKLFNSHLLSIAGFGILQDLGKLMVSFPHLPCFSTYNSVIDLQAVSAIPLSKGERQNASSLQRMVGLMLQKKLDKTQQVSEWTRRPLSKEQFDYATLDAAVLPVLLQRLMSTPTIKRYNGQFFKTHSNLTSRSRFSFLDTKTETKEEGGMTWHIPMGREATMFTRPIARQTWPSCQASPGEPKLVPIRTGPTKKERAHLKKVGTTGEKPKPIQLSTLLANLDNLPIPGITLGYTKDSCVSRVVGHVFMNTLPEGTYIGFNRRSGVVETSNAWIVFCNFGGSERFEGKRASSGFMRDGRDFVFNLNPKNFNGKSSEKTLYDYVSTPVRSPEEKKQILLFARDGTRQKYTYCGRCKCEGFDITDSGKIDLLLNLLDFEELVGENRISDDFTTLVAKQNTVLEFAA
ncbi:unnamed protein product [Cylindrotheca closterium]|uniref:3'-5' exonuclease domain-containing protein n=1 Tax=Cylindrotheca closterium TaxID=2856 RepID=A0AAD2CV28_9STRA|nr:unnamed protein product [Cylindrotheca closterium]